MSLRMMPPPLRVLKALSNSRPEAFYDGLNVYDTLSSVGDIH